MEGIYLLKEQARKDNAIKVLAEFAASIAENQCLRSRVGEPSKCASLPDSMKCQPCRAEDALRKASHE